MNDNEKYIEEFVKNVPFYAPRQEHRETLKTQLLNAFPKHRLQPTVQTVHVWRTIMKSKITKLAAAAIIIAALVGIHQIGDSSLAWADVREAFLAQPWVHLQYDNGREQWISLNEGKFYYKGADGRIVFVNRVLNIRQIYDPQFGRHISENRPAIHPNGVIPPWKPKTVWEAIVEHWEEIAENGRTGHWEVERNIEQIDGKRLVRFDRYYNDPVGRRLLIKQIWADPETRLPVKVRERLSLADRKKQNRKFITGEFDFPESGPTSIYDLGVSRDLPITKDYDKIADPFIAEVVKAGNAALDRFPERYRAITWPADGDSAIEMVYSDGEKIHHNHYFNLVGEPDYCLKQPASAEEVLEWTETQVPVSIAIFDGSRSYTRRNPHPSPSFTTEPEPQVRVTRGAWLFSSSRPHKQIWPYISQPAARFELIEDMAEEMSGYIGLRINAGDIRREFYIDPEHDYICVRWIWWKQRSGNWEKKREYESSNLVQLPDGQWYVGRRVLITYPDPERGTVRGGANWNVDFRVLEGNEYPPDTFNGEKLLQGAKVETY